MKLLLCVLLLVLLPRGEGYIWAWMLSLPYNSPEDAASLTRTPPAKGPTVTCDHDRGCGRGLFCDRHFGLCVALRQDGQYCRKDSHCARGLGCMFGRCQRAIPGGHEGSRCRHDKDCGPSMCCARHHGETICQRRLPAGHSCFIPEGGLAFSLNQRCPCEEGLTCSAAPPPREKEFDYSPGAAWKCLSPSLRDPPPTLSVTPPPLSVTPPPLSVTPPPSLRDPPLSP